MTLLWVRKQPSAKRYLLSWLYPSRSPSLYGLSGHHLTFLLTWEELMILNVFAATCPAMGEPFFEVPVSPSGENFNESFYVAEMKWWFADFFFAHFSCPVLSVVAKGRIQLYLSWNVSGKVLSTNVIINSSCVGREWGGEVCYQEFSRP